MIDAEELARWEALIDREAIGESLEPSEREWVAAYESAHPELAHERAIFEGAIESLRERLDAEDELGLARQAAATLERYRAERDRSKHDRPSRSIWIAGALALAAGLALWIGLRTPDADEPAKLGHVEQELEPEPATEQSPRIAALSPIGRLRVVAGDESLELGASLEPGASLSSARACVVWSAPTAVVCFDGELQLESGAGPGERRLRLESGRLVAALDPLGPGQRFTIETATGSVSAIGTVFAVELGDGGAWVSVLEGRVALRDPELRTLLAGQRVRLGDEPSQLEVLEPDVLQHVAEQLRRDPDSAPNDPAPEPLSVTETPAETSKPLTAKQLAAAAQRERAAKHYEQTARLYRELLRRYPDSPEAANVPVRLGDLLASTGDHEGALAAYELYLERGAKPLAPEAEYGRIRALRALGRKTEERAAIEAFIEARPDDHRVAELQARL